MGRLVAVAERTGRQSAAGGEGSRLEPGERALARAGAARDDVGAAACDRRATRVGWHVERHARERRRGDGEECFPLAA